MSGAVSRQTRLQTPPKSTLPMSRSCSRKTSTTLPGIPRHMCLSLTGRGGAFIRGGGGGDRQLAEAQAAVVGRDLAMPVHAEAVGPQPLDRLREEQGVHENTAAEDDHIRATLPPYAATHLRDDF